MKLGRVLTGLFKNIRSFIIPAVLVVFAIEPAAGQLTAEDIAALKVRAIEEGWTFEVGENSATRRPIEQLCGLIVSEEATFEEQPVPITEGEDLPAAFDWREYGGCTPIKDQDGCGSCWAHSAMGTFESKIKIVDSVEVDLSEQWLISCTHAGTCRGGGTSGAFNFMYKWLDDCGEIGAVLEADFPYAAVDLPCQCPYERADRLDGWKSVGYSYNPSVFQIKLAIFNHGPVSASVYVNNAFRAYNDGVFNACEDNTQAALYGIYGGGHTWPSSPIEVPFEMGPTNMDMNASESIWAWFVGLEAEVEQNDEPER